MINKNDLNSPILVGELIGINFVVERIQAAGHNYTIYSAKLQGNQQAVSVALKVAKDEFVTIAITNENHVIGSIQNTKHFAKIFESGRHRQFNYIVTQMLGPNLRDLALNHPSFTFSLKTLLKFAYQAIDSLQSLHQAGFVHGSVIAKNFLIGNTQQTSGNFYLIDFSECSPFNFTDTSRGSLQTQITNQNQQQNINGKTPEVDLIDVMNIIVEIQSLLETKHKMTNQNTQIQQKLYQEFPSELKDLYNAIMSYIPQQVPDYTLILQSIIKTAANNNIDLDSPFEWEINNEIQQINYNQQQQITQLYQSLQQLGNSNSQNQQQAQHLKLSARGLPVLHRSLSQQQQQLIQQQASLIQITPRNQQQVLQLQQQIADVHQTPRNQQLQQLKQIQQQITDIHTAPRNQQQILQHQFIQKQKSSDSQTTPRAKLNLMNRLSKIHSLSNIPSITKNQLSNNQISLQLNGTINASINSQVTDNITSQNSLNNKTNNQLQFNLQQQQQITPRSQSTLTLTKKGQLLFSKEKQHLNEIMIQEQHELKQKQQLKLQQYEQIQQSHINDQYIQLQKQQLLSLNQSTQKLAQLQLQQQQLQLQQQQQQQPLLKSLTQQKFPPLLTDSSSQSQLGNIITLQHNLSAQSMKYANPARSTSTSPQSIQKSSNILFSPEIQSPINQSSLLLSPPVFSHLPNQAFQNSNQIQSSENSPLNLFSFNTLSRKNITADSSQCVLQQPSIIINNTNQQQDKSPQIDNKPLIQQSQNIQLSMLKDILQSKSAKTLQILQDNNQLININNNQVELQNNGQQQLDLNDNYFDEQEKMNQIQNSHSLIFSDQHQQILSPIFSDREIEQQQFPEIVEKQSLKQLQEDHEQQKKSSQQQQQLNTSTNNDQNNIKNKNDDASIFTFIKSQHSEELSNDEPHELIEWIQKQEQIQQQKLLEDQAKQQQLISLMQESEKNQQAIEQFQLELKQNQELLKFIEENKKVNKPEISQIINEQITKKISKCLSFEQFNQQSSKQDDYKIEDNSIQQKQTSSTLKQSNKKQIKKIQSFTINNSPNQSSDNKQLNINVKQQIIKQDQKDEKQYFNENISENKEIKNNISIKSLPKIERIVDINTQNTSFSPLQNSFPTPTSVNSSSLPSQSQQSSSQQQQFSNNQSSNSQSYSPLSSTSTQQQIQQSNSKQSLKLISPVIMKQRKQISSVYVPASNNDLSSAVQPQQQQQIQLQQLNTKSAHQLQESQSLSNNSNKKSNSLVEFNSLLTPIINTQINLIDNIQQNEQMNQKNDLNQKQTNLKNEEQNISSDNKQQQNNSKQKKRKFITSISSVSSPLSISPATLQNAMHSIQSSSNIQELCSITQQNQQSNCLQLQFLDKPIFSSLSTQTQQNNDKKDDI